MLSTLSLSNVSADVTVAFLEFKKKKGKQKSSSVTWSQQGQCTDSPRSIPGLSSWLQAVDFSCFGSHTVIPPTPQLHRQDQVRFSLQSGPWVLQWVPMPSLRSFMLMLLHVTAPALAKCSSATYNGGNINIIRSRADDDLWTSSGRVGGKREVGLSRNPKIPF